MVASIANVQTVQAQGEHKGTIKTNFFGWFAGQYQLGYEHVLNENFTVQLSAGLLTNESSYALADTAFSSGYSYSQKKTGFILIPELRYYLSPSATYMEGMYFSAFGRYRSSTWDLDDTGAVGIADVSRIEGRKVLSAGFVIGYSHYLGNGFNAEIFAGPQFKTTSSSRDYEGFVDEAEGNAYFSSKFPDFSIADIESEGVGLRFGLNIGFGL